MFAEPPPATPSPPHPELQYRKPSTLQRPSPTPSEDEDMPLPKLNFHYNEAGEVVYNPSPSPTPSPTTRQGSGRASLSRSDSAPSVIDQVPSSTSSSRHFTRVSSGPVAFATPGASSTRAPLTTGLASTGRKISGAPRRVRLEDLRESMEQEQGRESSDMYPIASGSAARPLAEVAPVPQRSLSVQGRQMLPVPSRAVRPIKRAEPISEADYYEENEPIDRPRSALASSAGVRPRRSASMSEANAEDAPPVNFNQYLKTSTARGPRRVTMEEKLRQEQELAMREAQRDNESEGSDDLERRALELINAHAPPNEPKLPFPEARHETRHSPSPPNLNIPHLRSVYSHQRKDSDTLRSTAMPAAASPTVMNGSRGLSPAHREFSSHDPGARAFHNGSSNANGLQTGAIAMQRHRRSPTAPEPPTTSAMMAPPPRPPQGQTWASGDGREPVSENERNDDLHMQFRQKAVLHDPNPPLQQQNGHAGKMGPPPVPLRQTQSTSQIAQPQQAQAAPNIGARHLVVNKKGYARLDMIGKGGSSRVYRVMSAQNEIYAIKRVSLDRTDAEAMNGYMNEIALLKRLEGNSRIIRLIDSEVRAGPHGAKGYLMLVMECGEIDLARLLQEQQREPLDLVWVAYYFKQMLQAVQVIHEEKIVHSDLKPANFVLVKGQLKLIDFGIANAIANDTTNIQRDHQVGTVNFMSPEAIEIPDGLRRLKVGRQSDVWSLGCILYQMVYGQPPFQHLSVVQKMRAIPDDAYTIDYPDYSPLVRDSSGFITTKSDRQRVHVPTCVKETIRRCLIRNPKERATIPELLEENWLTLTECEPARTAEPAKPGLVIKSDETKMNAHFMKQLLTYAMKLGLEGTMYTGQKLQEDADRLINELRAVQGNS